MLVSLITVAFEELRLANECNSLERDPTRRASPKKMLEHPWMVDMRSKRVNMVKYLSFVWGWDDAGAKKE